MDNFVTVLLQIHSSICVPKIIKTWFDKVIEKIKRVQFFASQCRTGSVGHCCSGNVYMGQQWPEETWFLALPHSRQPSLWIPAGQLIRQLSCTVERQWVAETAHWFSNVSVCSRHWKIPVLQAHASVYVLPVYKSTDTPQPPMSCVNAQPWFMTSVGLGPNDSHEGDLVEAPGRTSGWQAMTVRRTLCFSEIALHFIPKGSIWYLGITSKYLQTCHINHQQLAAWQQQY